MIKVITFIVGVDVLGFPLFNRHVLKYKQDSKYIVGVDPYNEKNLSHSIGVSTYNNGQVVFHNKNTLKK